MMGQAGSAQEWAVMTFGGVYLGDERRTQRAVMIARALARDPMGSLPKQMGSQAAAKGAYRLLENSHTSYEHLMRPHLHQTRERMHECKRILLVQDTTEIDYSHHPKTEGLGPVGHGIQQGYLLQSVLAIDPTSASVFGLAAQEPFLRQSAPEKETSHQRLWRKDKESQVWARQARVIGVAPQGCEYIHVGDRGSDIFAFMQECATQHAQFLLRMHHDRKIDLKVELTNTPIPSRERRRGSQRSKHLDPVRRLVAEVESWPAMGEQTIHLLGNHTRPARDAHLLISWGRVRLWPPDEGFEKGALPLVVTLVRTWEPNPPEGKDGLEWILLSSSEVHSEEEAWERVQWYRMRWIVEDYHQCLKTGCDIEGRQLQTYEGLRTILGFLAPLAVRLLQLREVARSDPERPALSVLPADVVAVVAHLARVSPQKLSSRRCWHRIAQLGGFLGRKGDGEPGWKTLWKGWWHIHLLVEGVHLASQLSLE